MIYTDDRKYMGHVLGTLILSHLSRGSTTDCDQVAKALIRKFLFLKEYVSYFSGLYEN